MALDDTVAGANSNSYLSVADADEIAKAEALGLNVKRWRAATLDEKEVALVRATNEIDDYIVFSSPYDPLTPQRLLFPRVQDLDPVTSAPMLPRSLRRATFLQAAYLLSNADEIDASMARRARGLVNFANPDGTGGQLGEVDLGRLHPAAMAAVGGLAGSGAVVGWIVTD
jgi:hypothetical protein